MVKNLIFPAILFSTLIFNNQTRAQDTFSIVGLDTLTGEVGSAGASCVDLFAYNINDPSFLGDLIPGKGAINTQASYLSSNQVNARTRMNLGDSPAQIIAWLQANDVQSNPAVRQYGIVGSYSGTPYAAAHTGSNCFSYANHVVGINYSIQGNILSGQAILDSMESKFKKTPGTLACKLMAALQGAKVVGADTRCAPNNSSSLFAFLKVSQTTDVYGSPYISIGVRTATNTFIEPIDSLQTIANGINLCSIVTGLKNNSKLFAVNVFPNPASDAISILNYSPYGTEGITLVNSTGQVVMTLNELPANHLVDISNLPVGIYFAEIEFKNTTERKFLKLVRAE